MDSFLFNTTTPISAKSLPAFDLPLHVQCHVAINEFEGLVALRHVHWTLIVDINGAGIRASLQVPCGNRLRRDGMSEVWYDEYRSCEGSTYL